MELETVLQEAAKAARERRRTQYYDQTGNDPDEVNRPVLLGSCAENAVELSCELYNRDIKHKFIMGAIIADFIEIPDSSTMSAEQALDTIDQTEYLDDEYGYDPKIWETVPKPKSKDEIPVESQHFWIEVNELETRFYDNTNITRDTQDIINEHHWHVEIATEARHKPGKIHIEKGHPENHYIRPDDAVIQPWKFREDCQ